MKLYTLGYKNWSFYDFIDKIKEIDAIVVDVRFSPKGYSPFWSKSNLDKTLKNKYIHIPELGNKNYNSPDKPIEISDIDYGTAKVLESVNLGFDCLLLCACEDVEKCHRKVVAEHIQSKSKCEIINL